MARRGANVTTRTPRGSTSPARIPPRLMSPRWQGDPDQRPPTDAEDARRRRKQRAIQRFFAIIGVVALGVFVLNPHPLLLLLREVEGQFAEPAATVGLWLQRAHPVVRYGLVLLLGSVLVHLSIGLGLLLLQQHRRRQRELATFLIDLARSEQSEPGRGVDIFAGLGELLTPAGRLTGTEDTLVFALVNHTDDHRVRLAIRGLADSPTRQATLQAVRNLVSGAAPGATTQPAADELQTLIGREAPLRDGFVGSADFVLLRSPSFPLKDLAMFIGSDPLGPLATALDRRDGVRYTAFELIMRALPPKEDWRAPLREQIGAIQGSVNPEDIAAYEALLRKVEGYGFDLVIRCIVVAETRFAAVRQLREMHNALRSFSRPAGSARQALLRRGAKLPGPNAGYTLIPLTAATIGAAPLPGWGWQLISSAVGGTLLGGALGWFVIQTLPTLQQTLAQTGIPRLPFTTPPGTMPLLVGFMLLAGGLGGLALHPRRRSARARDRLALLHSHAHHSVWPGYRWTPFPAPGKRRSILAPYELAALWHPPSLELEAQFAWRTGKHLPAPPAAFLDPLEAQRAEQRTIVPRPATPAGLGASRLGIAYARQRNGELALIGPTLRDLRQGWDTLGGTGSGKSSLIETMVFEIARIGGGCGVIDAKGDLADRLLRILPREAYERVVVIDTTAEAIPCINPFDRRIVGTRPRDVVAGEIGEIFARIEPEIWAGAIGMQQALLMSISAILEGEREPSLLHLQRFLLAPAYRRVVLARVFDRSVRDYWLKQVPQMPEKIKASIESLKRRIDMLIGSETGQQLLCQPQSTIDLGAIIRNQGILIIKFVPERIGHTNAAYWSAVIFQSIISATFQQQVERDPEQRWDWPLFVDEVQMFVKAERAEDAERMWTRTRSMGVGLIGAHQGLNQLGEKLGGIVLNVIGGMCLTSGVRDDARSFVDAYANQGVQVEDFTGIKAREELMIRFPVAGRDQGAISAIPRERPFGQPDPPESESAQPFSLPPYQPRNSDEATALALLDDLERNVADLRSRIEREGDEQERAQPPDETMFAETVYRAVANRWLDQMHPQLAAAWREREGLSDEQAQTRAWAEIQAMIADLRAIDARRAQHRAAALAAAASAQLAAADLLSRLSQYRYGVNPIINACFAAALVRRYETDDAPPPKADRRQRARTPEPSGPPPQIAPPANTQRSAVVVSLPARAGLAFPVDSSDPDDTKR
jgi:hypothetical protein